MFSFSVGVNQTKSLIQDSVERKPEIINVELHLRKQIQTRNQILHGNYFNRSLILACNDALQETLQDEF